MTLDAPSLGKLTYLLEHFGVTVAAITGVLAARDKQVDLFGVLVLALVTAFGGGTVRDLILDATPVFWVGDPKFLLNAAGTALVTFYLVRYHELPVNVLMVADAFVLALFTMVGTRKALEFQTADSIAVAMGVTTGVAGGIIRDLLLGEIPLVFRPSIYLYATAAFAGASSLIGLRHLNPGGRYNVVAAILVTLALRLAGIRWRLKLPVFRPKSSTVTTGSTPPAS